MSLRSIDLIVPDVPAATRFFVDVVGLNPTVEDERFAEIPAGEISLLLSPDAMVPVSNAAGIILHFEVSDVNEAETRARQHNVEILQETMKTDWGWESCLVAGPAGIIIDFYRSLPETPS